MARICEFGQAVLWIKLTASEVTTSDSRWRLHYRARVCGLRGTLSRLGDVSYHDSGQVYRVAAVRSGEALAAGNVEPDGQGVVAC